MTKSKNLKPVKPEVFTPEDYVDNSPDTYPNEKLGIRDPENAPESSNEVLGIPTPSAEAARIASMPDEWKERNKIMVEERSPLAEDTVNVPELPEDWSSDAVEPTTIGLSDIKSDESLSERPTDVPLVDTSAFREPIPYSTKVGLSVLFGGEYAAIITKVWDNGLVNLIVFSAEHPVSDIKTKVPYGEGPNTWKEIN